MATTTRSELMAALASVEFLSPYAIRLGTDAPVPVAPGPADPLLAAIQAVLYAGCYSQRLGHAVVPPPPDAGLVARLSRANAAQDRWDPGWQVYRVAANGQVFVLKGDRQRAAQPGEYIMEQAPGLPPQPGAVVSLRVARDSSVLQPGFYHMAGEVLGDVWDENFLVRFYFHCTPQHVDALIAPLTRTLNRNRVPYRMKALSDATHYTRTDSVVLYCARRYLPVVGWIVRGLPDDALRALREPVPLCAMRFAPGIGLAEDPGNGDSFGMNRCHLMAQAILEAARQGRVDAEARLAALELVFARNGLSAERPHLRAPAKTDFLADLLTDLPQEAAA